MYFEQAFGDRLYLIYQDLHSKQCVPIMVALAYKGELYVSDEYDQTRDYESVKLFQEAYDLVKVGKDSK